MDFLNPNPPTASTGYSHPEHATHLSPSTSAGDSRDMDCVVAGLLCLAHAALAGQRPLAYSVGHHLGLWFVDIVAQSARKPPVGRISLATKARPWEWAHAGTRVVHWSAGRVSLRVMADGIAGLGYCDSVHPD